LLKKAHLLRFPHPSSLQRTSEYASLLRILGALHLGIFEHPAKNDFFSNLLDQKLLAWIEGIFQTWAINLRYLVFLCRHHTSKTSSALTSPSG